MDLALNNLQRLICHKTQETNQPNQVKILVVVVCILLCANVFRRDMNPSVFPLQWVNLGAV